MFDFVVGHFYLWITFQFHRLLFFVYVYSQYFKICLANKWQPTTKSVTAMFCYISWRYLWFWNIWISVMLHNFLWKRKFISNIAAINIGLLSNWAMNKHPYDITNTLHQAQKHRVIYKPIKLSHKHNEAVDFFCEHLSTPLQRVTQNQKSKINSHKNDTVSSTSEKNELISLDLAKSIKMEARKRLNQCATVQYQHFTE